MKLVAIFLSIWLSCGFFAWGIELADLRYKNRGCEFLDCRHDQSFAAVWGEAGGPLSLLASLMLSGFAEHGMQWTCSVERAAAAKETH